MNAPPIFTKDGFQDQVGHFDWAMNNPKIPIAMKKGKRGSGIKVAIVDTGVDYLHDDLQHAVRGGVNFTTEYRSDYLDRVGHGTFCSGIIAGADNGVGITGIAPNIELYAVKVIDDHSFGTPDWAASGIEWCIDHGMDVVNLSFENQKPYKPLELAIQRAAKAGIVLVAASGNMGDNESATVEISYPGAYPEVISVAAHDAMMEHADFAASNPEVDITAPGVNIVSCFPGNAYTVWSGTSMAAPFMTGVIALLKAERPSLSLQDIEQLLEKSSIDKGLPGQDSSYGWGILSPEHIFSLFT
jgi:subtilisin family serine protease